MPRASSPRPIRWRKGEIIGAGAYGRVYMGMDLDSGELLAVKQVLITAVNNTTKEKAQAHIRELEEEVRLLRNLSHPNIVRYLGTVREDEALNILLEFVPGGSIASLLGKFGSFTEPVIRMYTKQLLLGLEYLHKNNILHRDIKGANILVDNKGCIKLADFGASKKVVELATISEAKSMKGTPYWMAPEVIRQTGHNWQADIWSVGCTVIEMATGKPPWSQQFQEVAALFHIGTTKSHPPIPEHISMHAKNFLLKCLQREPRLRPSASELLRHPFVSEKVSEAVDNSKNLSAFPVIPGEQTGGPIVRQLENHKPMVICHATNVAPNSSFRMGPTTLDRAENLQPIWEPPTDEHYRASYEDDDLNCSVRLDSVRSEFLTESFNPMSEPSFAGNGWEYKASDSYAGDESAERAGVSLPRNKLVDDNTQDDDDDVTESKIRAFLDEKALELKRLQTPLYEELYSIWNVSNQNASFIAPMSPAAARLPGTGTSSKSPSKGSSLSGRSVGLRSSRDSEASVSSGSPSGGCAPSASVNFSPLAEVPSPKLNEWKGLLNDVQHHLPPSPSLNSTERQRLWKEELQQELEMKREEKRKLTRQASAATNTTQSPNKEKSLQRYGSRLANTPPPSSTPTLRQ